jgi:hypothetical protein
LLAAFSKGGIGGGDVRLAPVLVHPWRYCSRGHAPYSPCIRVDSHCVRPISVHRRRRRIVCPVGFCHASTSRRRHV